MTHSILSKLKIFVKQTRKNIFNKCNRQKDKCPELLISLTNKKGSKQNNRKVDKYK